MRWSKRVSPEPWGGCRTYGFVFSGPRIKMLEEVEMTKLVQDILLLAAREVAKDLARQALKQGALTAWGHVRDRRRRPAPVEVRCVQRVPMSRGARERT